jgi:hypothetical protein
MTTLSGLFSQISLDKTHPEQLGRLAARLLADDLMFIFKLKWKTNIIGQNMHRKQYCFTVSICHLVKVDPKTLESNCYSKNYLANSRFVPTIDLTFPPIGGTFFHIQDGSKPVSLEILCYLVPGLAKKHL